MGQLQTRSRLLIVGGWGLIVVSSIATFAIYVHLGYFGNGQSLGSETEIVLPVFASTAAVVAWSWLTRIKVSDDQLIFVQRAFYALGVQALLIAGTLLAEVSVSEGVVNTYQLAAVALIFQAVGGIAVFVGFVLLAGAFTPKRELPREVPQSADLSELDRDDE